MANTRSLAVAPPPVWAPTLFDSEPVAPDPAFRGAHRIGLAHDAWIEHVPGWLHGAADVFEDLVAKVPWRAGKRLMYGRFVDEPRLHAYDRSAVEHCPVAGAAIDRMAGLLSRRYGLLLPNVGLNLYRDGTDSVAWHGDRVARDRVQSTIAIVSVGGARPFRLRPRSGGARQSIELGLGGGDLLVMGGTCQRTWYHCVPKVRQAPPRISITFRPDW
jgi:alkylated DNA repair dioxygenase AlkB